MTFQPDVLERLVHAQQRYNDEHCVHLRAVTAMDEDDLVGRLTERVVAQDDAVRRSARRLLVGFGGLRLDPDAPRASLMFIGPTGVGKTQLAMAIAEVVYGDPNAVLRFDMSEYVGEWATAGLIGAKPGYVGHGRDSAQLTGRVAARPASVVLFDEIEKADPSVWRLLLQALDAGRLTDTTGRSVSFAETVVVFTTNCGAAVRRTNMGFRNSIADDNSEAMRALRRVFSPEFLGRIDDLVCFEPLDASARFAILRSMASRVTELQQARYGRTLLFGDDALEAIAANADPHSGSRGLRAGLESLLAEAAPLLATNSATRGALMAYVDTRTSQVGWREA